MDNSSVALGSGEENIVFQDHLEEMFFQTFKSSKTGFTSLSCIQIIFMIGNTSVGIWWVFWTLIYSAQTQYVKAVEFDSIGRCRLSSSYSAIAFEASTR